MAKGYKHIRDDGSTGICSADPSKPNYRGCEFEANGEHLPADASPEQVKEFETQAEKVAQKAAQQDSAVGAGKKKKEKPTETENEEGETDWAANINGDTESMRAERVAKIKSHGDEQFGQLFERVRQSTVDNLVAKTQKLSPVPKWNFRTDKEATDYLDSANNEAMIYNAQLFNADESEIKESGFESRDDLLDKTTEVISNAREINEAKRQSGYYNQPRFDHNDFDDQVSWEEAHEPKFIDVREGETLERQRHRTSRSMYFEGYEERMNTFANIKRLPRDGENQGGIESDKQDQRIADAALEDVSVSLRAYSGNSDASEKGKTEYLKDAEEKMDLVNLVRKKRKANEDLRNMLEVSKNGKR